MEAIKNGNAESAQIILEDKKFNPNFYANKAGLFPLGFAITLGR